MIESVEHSTEDVVAASSTKFGKSTLLNMYLSKLLEADTEMIKYVFASCGSELQKRGVIIKMKGPL